MFHHFARGTGTTAKVAVPGGKVLRVLHRCYETHLNNHLRQEEDLNRSRATDVTSRPPRRPLFQLRIELSFWVLPLHAGCHHSVSMCSSAPLALVPHIPTPPLHDRGSYRHSTQALTATSGWRLGRAEGWSTNMSVWVS